MFSFLSLQTLDTATMQAPGVCARIMTARNKKSGFGTITNPERFHNQDFQQITQICQVRNCRYIDGTFPPDRRSIGPGILRPEDFNRVEWKRPYVSVFMARSWGVISHYDSQFNESACAHSLQIETFRTNIWCFLILEIWKHKATSSHFCFFY